MVYLGIVKGRVIEFEKPLPFSAGQQVEVSVEAVGHGEAPAGSPARILAAMRALPTVPSEDVDELERLIESSKLPVRNNGIFDDQN